MSAGTAFRAVARNTDSGTVNAMHADAGAQAHGYRGALVPGGTVLAYLCRPVLAEYGRDWVEHGSVAVAWRRPTYVGDELDVMATEGSGALTLVARRPGEDRAVAEGAARPSSGPIRPAGADGTDDPVRLAAGEPLPVGLAFRPWELTITDDDAVAYLDAVDEPSPVLRAERLVHPAHLQKLASHVLFRNVTFDTAFQIAATAESEHVAAVPWGTALRISCRTTDEWEDRGHRWSATETVVRGVDGTPYAVLRRTSIYRLASERSR